MPTSAVDATRFGPNNCIDDVIETPANFWDPNYSLCHTDVERAPLLAIDYGEKATVSVEKVVLYNRKDCCYARTRNVEILLVAQIPATGEEKFSGGQLLGTFHGSATRGQRIVIHSRRGWENKSSRYLIIQIVMAPVLAATAVPPLLSSLIFILRQGVCSVWAAGTRWPTR